MRSQTSENAPKIDFMTFSEKVPLIVKGGSMGLVASPLFINKLTPIYFSNEEKTSNIRGYN